MAIKAQVAPENNHAAVRVKDLESAADFYENMVGLPRLRIMGEAADRPRGIFYPGLQLIRAEDDDTSIKGVFDHVGLSIDNIDEICANLVANGVEFEAALATYEFPELGRSQQRCFFRDPEGNRIELIHWL